MQGLAWSKPVTNWRKAATDGEPLFAAFDVSSTPQAKPPAAGIDAGQKGPRHGHTGLNFHGINRIYRIQRPRRASFSSCPRPKWAQQKPSRHCANGSGARAIPPLQVLPPHLFWHSQASKFRPRQLIQPLHYITHTGMAPQQLPRSAGRRRLPLAVGGHPSSPSLNPICHPRCRAQPAPSIRCMGCGQYVLFFLAFFMAACPRPFPTTSWFYHWLSALPTFFCLPGGRCSGGLRAGRMRERG